MKLTIAIIIIGLFIYAFSHNSDSNEYAPKDPNAFDRDVACYMLEKQVKSQLKAPATAVFPLWTAQGWQQSREGDVIKVKSYVDAQNSFGALLRTHFVGYFKQNSIGEWYLTDVKEVEK